MELRFIVFCALAYVGGSLSSYVDRTTPRSILGKLGKFIINKIILIFFMFLAFYVVGGPDEAIEAIEMLLSGEVDTRGLQLATFLGFLIALWIRNRLKKG